jgi:hypothetical protein
MASRTPLDVLNAEFEYLGSQIQLVTAKRDRVVAEYSIYGSIGRLDAQSLGLSVPHYDRLSTTTSAAVPARPRRMIVRSRVATSNPPRRREGMLNLHPSDDDIDDNQVDQFARHRTEPDIEEPTSIPEGEGELA